MKKGWELLDRMDLSGESLPGQVLVELCGDSRVLVEHHKGVQQYTHTCIGIRAAFGIIQIYGRCLELKIMTRERLVISGEIDSVALIRNHCR